MMIEIVVGSGVAQLLKSERFKKNRFCWNKAIGGATYVVDLQTSRLSKKTERSFTFNLGIFHSFVWTTCWGKAAPKFVREVDCFPRKRLGTPTASHVGERWWNVTEASNFDLIAEEIVDLLISSGLPFLHEMSSLDKINECFQQRKDALNPLEKIYLAIIKDELGEFEQSEALLLDAETDYWKPRVEFVRQSLKMNTHARQQHKTGSL